MKTDVGARLMGSVCKMKPRKGDTQQAVEILEAVRKLPQRAQEEASKGRVIALDQKLQLLLEKHALHSRYNGANNEATVTALRAVINFLVIGRTETITKKEKALRQQQLIAMLRPRHRSKGKKPRGENRISAKAVMARIH